MRYAAAWDKTGLHPGQVQTIASSKRDLSGSHTITDVRITHRIGQVVLRQVVAVSTTRLPSTLRQKFQQTFGGGGGAPSTSAVTVVTGGTYLSSPASLGGADVQWRACDTPTRVPNAQFYDAPAALSVTVQGLVSAHGSINVTVILWDETAAASSGFSSTVSCTATPAPFNFNALLVAGHRYWLYVESGTAGTPATACGQLVSR